MLEPDEQYVGMVTHNPDSRCSSYTCLSFLILEGSSFMARSKSKFRGYKLDEYPVIRRVAFPSHLFIAYAVCGNKCGTREFVVDGQTQVCQNCGKLMFRTEVAKYRLVKS